MNVSKFYYINLDKRPNRKDHFLNECKRENVPYEKVERFSAVDGEIYNFSESELKMFENGDFNKYWFCKRILGNQLSHYYIMKDIVKNNYEFSIIFQDDSILIPNFMNHLNELLENLPKDSEMVNIGFHKFASGAKFVRWDFNEDFKTLSKKRLNKSVCILNDGVNPCSLAYVLTLQGAKNMVNHFEKNGFLRATDGNFNDYCQKKNIFYGSIPVLVTGNENLPSDIFIK
jgi:GR25 family glycosyltransferase involved in LPS biosynthesis